MLDKIIDGLIGDDEDVKKIYEDFKNLSEREKAISTIESLGQLRDSSHMDVVMMNIGLMGVLESDDYDCDIEAVEKLAEAYKYISEFNFFKHIRVIVEESNTEVNTNKEDVENE